MQPRYYTDTWRDPGGVGVAPVAAITSLGPVSSACRDVLSAGDGARGSLHEDVGGGTAEDDNECSSSSSSPPCILLRSERRRCPLERLLSSTERLETVLAVAAACADRCDGSDGAGDRVESVRSSDSFACRGRSGSESMADAESSASKRPLASADRRPYWRPRQNCLKVIPSRGTKGDELSVAPGC